MKFSRSIATGLAGVISLAAVSLPVLASADIFDYQYCVNYGYPTQGDCQSQGYAYHTQPYIYPAGSTQNGAYYGGGQQYSQQYYYPQQNYGYQYQQPSYYYPQQQSYYQPQQYSYYPQTYYQPSYSYAPTITTNNGNYYYGGGYGGGYYR